MKRVVCLMVMLAASALSSPAFAETINWAGVDTRGGNVTGPPDGQFLGLGGSVTLGAFGPGVSYSGLAGLLGISQATLQQADVIGFEGNGGSPAPSGGWESSRWLFSDGLNSLTLDWDESVGATWAPEVVANGSIFSPDYAAFFGFTYPTPNREVISYLLFNLPGFIDTSSPTFNITITAGHDVGLPGEGTPDPEAVGIFQAVPEPTTLVFLLTAGISSLPLLRKKVG